ncbi:hypothetical protein BCEN4_1640009 [Burkholderia cenocepacia]|nr:hypothetical protein BCEN4_1640009 [Burkholderia cenocepacia]
MDTILPSASAKLKTGWLAAYVSRQRRQAHQLGRSSKPTRSKTREPIPPANRATLRPNRNASHAIRDRMYVPGSHLSNSRSTLGQYGRRLGRLQGLESP